LGALAQFTRTGWVAEVVCVPRHWLPLTLADSTSSGLEQIFEIGELPVI
jgi:hypothetical protein